MDGSKKVYSVQHGGVHDDGSDGEARCGRRKQRPRLRMATTMPAVVVDNVGSAARDFCMLERNALSHFRLSLLLSLLASSVLLRVQIPLPDAENIEYNSKLAVPMASLLFTCSLAVLFAGLLEYFSGQTDLRIMRPFLRTTRLHAHMLFVLAFIILAICIVLLVASDMFAQLNLG